MSDHDDYDPQEVYEEPSRGMGGGAKMAVVAAVVVALGAAAGIGWFAYQQGLKEGEGQPVPMIRAESEPIKRKPEEPGGMDVPHQDTLVFNRLAPGQVEEPVERLLPPPEAPAARPEPTQPAQTQSVPTQAAPSESGAPAAERAPQPASNDGPPVTASPREGVAVEAPALPDPPPASAVSGGETAQTEIAAAPAAPEPEPEQPAAEPAPAAKPAPKPAQTAAASGPAWRIQLAAVSSRDAASNEWKRMQSRYQDLLGSLGLNVQEAKLSKGTFFRIQAGPLADRGSAESLCQKLKSRKQDCLVVAP